MYRLKKAVHLDCRAAGQQAIQAFVASRFVLSGAFALRIAETLSAMSTVVFAIGMKVALKAEPDPVKPESVQLVTMISDCTKSVDDSLSVKVIVAVSPAFKALLLLVIAMVGGAVLGITDIPPFHNDQHQRPI